MREELGWVVGGWVGGWVVYYLPKGPRRERGRRLIFLPSLICWRMRSKVASWPVLFE